MPPLRKSKIAARIEVGQSTIVPVTFASKKRVDLSCPSPKYNHNRKLPEYTIRFRKQYWLPRTPDPRKGHPRLLRLRLPPGGPNWTHPVGAAFYGANMAWKSEIRHLYVFFMNSSVSVYAVKRMLDPTMNRFLTANDVCGPCIEAAGIGCGLCLEPAVARTPHFVSSRSTAHGTRDRLHFFQNKWNGTQSALFVPGIAGRLPGPDQMAPVLVRSCEPQVRFNPIKEYALLTLAA